MVSDQSPPPDLRGNEAEKSGSAPGSIRPQERRPGRGQLVPGEKRSLSEERRQARRLERRRQKAEERGAESEEQREARRLERRRQKAEERGAESEEQREARRLERRRQKAEERGAESEEQREARRLERRQQKAEERQRASEEKRRQSEEAREKRRAELRQLKSEEKRRQSEEKRRQSEEAREKRRAELRQLKAEEKRRQSEEKRQHAEKARQERLAGRRQRKAQESRRQTEERQRERRSERRQQRDNQRWRWSDGRLTFFNLMRDRQRLPAVEVRPLEAEEIPTALVSRLRDPSLPPGAFSGAVYHSDGHIVPEFLEHDALTQHRVNRSINAPVMEQARIDAADRVYDTCIYLGRWSGHFGHFLLESLARAWYLTKVDRSTPLLFQQWDDRLNVPPFASAFLKALNVQPARIRIVAGRDLRVSKLILPSMQFWQGAKASPGMCTVFDHMRERMLQSRGGKGRTPEKVYFSRRGLSGVRASGQARPVIVNEEEAEIFFRSAGYEIVQPESLPVEEQVAIVANATHVAGPSGAALHLMLFNANPQAKLIELKTRPAVNQLLISAIRGNQAFHISCRRPDEPPDRTILEMDVVERAVREIG